MNFYSVKFTVQRYKKKKIDVLLFLGLLWKLKRKKIVFNKNLNNEQKKFLNSYVITVAASKTVLWELWCYRFVQFYLIRNKINVIFCSFANFFLPWIFQGMDCIAFIFIDVYRVCLTLNPHTHVLFIYYWIDFRLSAVTQLSKTNISILLKESYSPFWQSIMIFPTEVSMLFHHVSS